MLPGTTKRRPRPRHARNQLMMVYVTAISIVCNLMGGSLAVDAMLIDTQLERLRIHDICNTNTRNIRLYLDHGDSGWVSGYARAHQLEHMVDDFAVKTLARPKHNAANAALNRGECTLELVTCPSCRIKVTTSSLNIVNFRHCELRSSTTPPPIANSNWTNQSNDDTAGSPGGGDARRPIDAHHSASSSHCKCNYISFVEPPFETLAGNGRRICNGLPPPQPVVFTGNTRSLLIHFSLAHSLPEDAFNLTVSAERNLDQTFGRPTSPMRRLTAGTHRPDAVIESPFFPAASPRDLIKQHLITCTAPIASACSIRVLFTDYQIDSTARLEFFNADGDLIHMFSGLVFRPPVIVCDGPSLLMRFYANGGAALRYRAAVDFLPGSAQLAAAQSNGAQDTVGWVRPITECGGRVDTLGGAITMMNMVANQTERVRYDCVWLVRPSSRYLNAMPYLLLRVDAFEGFVEQSELSIHEGMASVRPQLGTIQWAGVHQKKQRINVINEYVLPTTTGFYVRFQGTFGPASKLALVYTVFSYESKTATQFECQNRKLIPLQLHCDGFDHCGDNSDELDTCQLAWKHDTYDRRWYSHTPNYYFPKTEQYPDMRAATIVFLVSTAGLVFLVAGIVVLLYRMGHWARDHRDIHGHLNTISELLDSQHMEEEDEDDIGDDLDPPAYESPPAYDEIIQVGMDQYYQKAAIAATMSHKESRYSGVVGCVHTDADEPVTYTSSSSNTYSNGCQPNRQIVGLSSASDCNLLSLSLLSLDNLTPSASAILTEPHNRIEVSNPTAGTIINTTVVELMAPASCDILTADPTLDSVVVIQANETGEYAKAATLTISNPNAKMSDPLWSLIESVSNGQRCGTDATTQQLVVGLTDDLQSDGDGITAFGEDTLAAS